MALIASNNIKGSKRSNGHLASHSSNIFNESSVYAIMTREKFLSEARDTYKPTLPRTKPRLNGVNLMIS